MCIPLKTFLAERSRLYEDPKEVYSQGKTNFLGLVMISSVFGFMIGTLGPKGSALLEFVNAVEAVVMKVVMLIIWYVTENIFYIIPYFLKLKSFRMKNSKKY